MMFYLAFVATVISWNPVMTIPQTPSILKTFNMEELIPIRHDFIPERLSVEWISDTEYLITEPNAINKYNALTQNHVTLVDQDELASLGRFTITSVSNDQNYLLLQSGAKKMYRYSNLADYYVYNREKKEIKNVGQGSLQVVVWSKRNALAYVQDNNVFYVSDVAHPNVITTLTTNGVPEEVYYGTTDWIYEEEVFYSPEAMWFSPKGTFLAVASFNDSKVESIAYPYYGNPSDLNNQYPETVHFKYPKAGRSNPEVALRVFKLDSLYEGGKVFDIPAPADIVGSDHILGRVDWATDENLVVLWLNRRQNVSVLVNCDLQQNKCIIQKELSEPNGWIDIKKTFYDKSGLKMLEVQPLTLDGRRYKHVARLDFATSEVEDLSPVKATVKEIKGWNEETDTVYYIVAPEMEPWQRQLWASSGGTTKCVTCQRPECHNVDGTFSPGSSYGIITCSAIGLPPISYLYEVKTNEFKLLSDNSKLANKLKQYKLPMVLFNRIILEEDVMSHIKLLLPPEMEPGKKYPMVLRVYSGPGTSKVTDNFDIDYYSTYLSSNRSFIVASIDVRGSGAMGVEALHAVNNALGTVEITDTLVAVRRLIALYDFIDSSRIGVWGWSYGGFASTMMLIKDENRTLACAAAVAPVSSWLYYDTIYTERYMDTPQKNPEGYKRSDLILQAEKLRGRKYLLIHGTGDDNVHAQNSLQLAKKLQINDIEFEEMTYTDENHSLRSVSRHLYHTLDRFWTECFRL